MLAAAFGRPSLAAQALPAMQPLEPAGPTLGSVTPTFRWTPADSAAASRPIRYRLRVARDAQLAMLELDTMLTDVERCDLPRALRPGPPLFWRVDATLATGAAVSTGLVGPHAVPPWATLTALNDPGGAVTDDPRPLFTWSSPAITSPPGPFRYDLFITRTAPGHAATAILGLSDTSQRPLIALELNVGYAWSLVVHAGSDTSLVRSTGGFIIVAAGAPPSTLLYQNFPNPFPTPTQDRTCIWFDLATAAPVELDILDLRGNRVRRLVPGGDVPPLLPPGRYGRGAAGGAICDPRFSWDGTAANGASLPAGVYVIRFQTARTTMFRRIVFRGRGR